MKADAMSEPSMEDILASIRRIIAEDPPGSRPSAAAPAPSTAAPAPATPASASAPLRPMQTLSPAPFDAPAEPELPRPSGADPFRLEMPSFTSAFPAPTARRATPSPAAAPADPFGTGQQQRIDPVLPQPVNESATSAAVSEATPGVSSPQNFSPSLSFGAPPRPSQPMQIPKPADRIDAQLSDLLGEAALPIGGLPSPSPSTSAEPSPAAMGRLSVGPSFANLARASEPAPAPEADRFRPEVRGPEPRPGFTVSRVGYLAEPLQETTLAPAKAEDDPFEFNLGPSPFARAKAEEADAAVETAPAVPPEPEFAAAEPVAAAPKSFASDIDALIAEVASKTAAADVPPAAPESETARAGGANDTREADAPASDVQAVRAISDDANVAPAAMEPVEAVEAEPAVPVAAAPGDTHIEAPVAAVEPAPRETEKVRDILPLAPAHHTVDAVSAAAASAVSPVPGLQALMRSQAQAEYLSAPAAGYAPAVIEPAASVLPPVQRTAEDALAELLRPMLRTWLAENMPKIVERALRQELAGQISADQKTAAE